MVKGERLDRWRSVRTASGTSAAAPVPARGDLVRAIVWLLTTARFGILLSQRGRSGRQRSVLNGDDRARQARVRVYLAVTTTTRSPTRALFHAKAASAYDSRADCA